MDFTLKTYNRLLTALRNQDYAFQPFAEYLQQPADKAVILRHDVEKRYKNALAIARLQHARGIRGTYYFRIINGKLQHDIIKEIAALGHEIGYHYDDFSHCNGDHEAAIQRFERHLTMLREIAPVKTICMEGAPLSKHDNRDLWKHYDYRNYGIIGEPYFDVDFTRVFYLTDTGRRWDGVKVSVRDKVVTSKQYAVRSKKEEGALKTRSTKDIIRAVEAGRVPGQIMITIHPQRWTDKPLPWLWELVWQNAKNAVKRVLVGRRTERRKV